MAESATPSELAEYPEEEKKPEFQSFFVESKEVLEILSQLPILPKGKRYDLHFQEGVNSLTKIFEKYQEQAQLLDPHLEQILTKIMAMAKPLLLDNNNAALDFAKVGDEQIGLRKAIFKILYILAKVRGYQTILKQFPHEIAELEGLFKALFGILPSEWETAYILWLWLSLIVMNPFDLKVVDSSSEGKLSQRMMEEAKKTFSGAGKASEGAAIFLARLVTRPEIQKTGIPELFSWASEVLKTSSDPFLKFNVCNSLVHVFKFGKREELAPHLDIIFDVMMQENKTNTVLRKMYIKIIQRMGLTYLKPRVAMWRYQKARVSLLQNLTSSASTTTTKQEDEEEDEIDVPSQIEEVVDKLLNGLRDKDTIVRWSAAKGVGRITMRLPRDFGDDIVKSILELFSEYEGDGAWHGGCLALAELARRGLLLPLRLNDVVPVIIKALKYDERKGSHSVGAHVRDAACYVCWAFARAYAAEIMKPYVQSLAESLLITAVYDREVNCRRAASAAFQENVGRQGNFPHGIEILTRADYFALSNRITAFTEISPFIAQFESYKKALIDDLVSLKVVHWDKAVRELAAQTLNLLVEKKPEYFVQQIIPDLIEKSVSSELHIRHGGLLGLAEVILGLKKINFEFSESLQSELRLVVFTIEAKRLYRGRGGEIMREAACRYIECMSQAQISLPEFIEVDSSVGSRKIKKKTTARFIETLEENLKHPNEDIVTKAVASFKAFTHQYLGNVKEAQTLVIDKFIKLLNTDENPATRRGLTLALSSLPKQVLLQHFDVIRKCIAKHIEVESNVELRDAEARRNAVHAMIALVEVVGVQESGVNAANVNEIFEALLLGTNDYSIDKRGDVGSWVREAALEALEKLAKLLSANDPKLFTEVMATRTIEAVLKQANEKIDRVRATAGTVLSNILFSTNPVIVNIPHAEAMKQIISQVFEESKSSYMLTANWSSPETTFPLFAKFLQFKEYAPAVLTGFIVSIGCLSFHVAKSSGEALVAYMNQATKLKQGTTEIQIPETLKQIMINSKNDERVILPLFKTLSLLISRNCLSHLQPATSTFTKDLVSLVHDEISGSQNIMKLLTAIPVFCELIAFEQPTRNAAIQELVLLLQSKFPKVRMTAGEQLFNTLQLCIDEIMEEDPEVGEEALSILMNTAWSGNIASATEAAKQLANLLKL